jgi:hypothetical protein
MGILMVMMAMAYVAAFVVLGLVLGLMFKSLRVGILIPVIATIAPHVFWYAESRYLYYVELPKYCEQEPDDWRLMLPLKVSQDRWLLIDDDYLSEETKSAIDDSPFVARVNGDERDSVGSARYLVGAERRNVASRGAFKVEALGFALRDSEDWRLDSRRVGAWIEHRVVRTPLTMAYFMAVGRDLERFHCRPAERSYDEWIMELLGELE